MSEIWGTVYPEAKLFSSYEPMKPNKLYTSKIHGRTCKVQTLLFQKGEVGKKKQW